MTKHILTKEQRAAGLIHFEDDHNLYIIDTVTSLGQPPIQVAVFSSSGATIQEIQKEANDYLIKRGT